MEHDGYDQGHVDVGSGALPDGVVAVHSLEVGAAAALPAKANPVENPIDLVHLAGPNHGRR